MKKSEQKESNPEALYAHRSQAQPKSISFARQHNIDLFSPRGDHAQDAFDQALSDELRDDDIDFDD